VGWGRGREINDKGGERRSGEDERMEGGEGWIMVEKEKD
jgi:hypothetical protein